MGTRTMVVLLAAAGAVLGLSGCGGAGHGVTHQQSSPAPSAANAAPAAMLPAELKTANDVRAALGDACVQDSGSSNQIRHFDPTLDPGIQEVVCLNPEGHVTVLLYGWDQAPTRKSYVLTKITKAAGFAKISNSPHACIVTSTNHPWAVSFPYFEMYSIPAVLQSVVDAGRAVKTVGDCQAG